MSKLKGGARYGARAERTRHFLTALLLASCSGQDVTQNTTALTPDPNVDLARSDPTPAAVVAAPEIPDAADAAKIDDWSWEADPDFGTEGAIKWRVSVKNLSDRTIDSAKVEFSAYDKDHHLVTTTFTYVDDIPPGETRDEESFADYHGGEDTARVVVAEVRFDD
jgi:hypothetical protein